MYKYYESNIYKNIESIIYLLFRNWENICMHGMNEWKTTVSL